MKCNKWTVGLAAAGAVGFVSGVRADDKVSEVQTALSSTTLSGFVDTSADWNLGTGNSHAPQYKYGGPGKADGFNLDMVGLTLEKPLDETEWAAGYRTDLLFGPDANRLGTSSSGVNTADFAIQQAYIALRTPVGNGLDFKVGVFDSIIGYESTEAMNDPNFTRSWGHTIEPSTHTGILSTYHLNNSVSLAAGVADTLSPTINGRASAPFGPEAESYKAYMASLALTAPDSWGFISGSSLYGGFVNGFNAGVGAAQTSLYLGTTVATPVTGLRVGLAYDYAGVPPKGSNTGIPVGATAVSAAYVAAGPNSSAYANALAAYASYQATDKLSLHGRAEYASLSKSLTSAGQIAGLGVPHEVFTLTGTVQYDLWKNVLSRLELRWDHEMDAQEVFGGTQGIGRNSNGIITTGTAQSAWLIAGNIIYKF
jgi:hypothetical protein